MIKRMLTYIRGFIILLFICVGCKDKMIVLSGPAKVCNHYNCADITIVQLTDQYYPPDHHMVRDDDRKYGAAWAEFLAFQYNIPLHVFERSVKGNEFEEFLETGRGGASVYYPSCVDDFDLDKFESIRDNIEDAYGRTITTLSYGCGKTDYIAQLPNDVLGGRNSIYNTSNLNENAITWYGDGLGYSGSMLDFSRNLSQLNRPASDRFYARIQKENVMLAVAVNQVETQVKKTINNSGFYTNFMHWDDWYKNNNDSLVKGLDVIEPLFMAMSKSIKHNGRNSGLDYNEAVEYLYAKETIDSIKWSYYDDKTLVIEVWKTEKRDRDYSRIDTPVTMAVAKDWVDQIGNFNLSYSNKLISAFYDKDQLLLNVRLDFEKTYEKITIDVDGSDEIYTLNNPISLIIQNQEAIIASEEVNFVLFRRRNSAMKFEIEIVDRTSSYSENYDIPRLEKGYHYFCGAIDRKRQSTLIEL